MKLKKLFLGIAFIVSISILFTSTNVEAQTVSCPTCPNLESLRCNGTQCVCENVRGQTGAPQYSSCSGTCIYSGQGGCTPSNNNGGGNNGGNNNGGSVSGQSWGAASLSDIGNLIKAPPGGVPSVGYVQVFLTATDLLIAIAILLALFFLLWGGLTWITSEGDKQKLAQARTRLTFAILGLAIALLAFFIINFVFEFFLGSGLTVGGGGGGPRLQ